MCPAPWRRRSLLPASDGALSGTVPRSRRSRASSGQTGRVIARPASATSFRASTRPSGRIGCAPVVSASRPWGTSLLEHAVPAVAPGRVSLAARCRRLQCPVSASLMAAPSLRSGVVHATTGRHFTKGSVPGARLRRASSVAEQTHCRTLPAVWKRAVRGPGSCADSAHRHLRGRMLRAVFAGQLMAPPASSVVTRPRGTLCRTTGPARLAMPGGSARLAATSHLQRGWSRAVSALAPPRSGARRASMSQHWPPASAPRASPRPACASSVAAQCQILPC